MRAGSSNEDRQRRRYLVQLAWIIQAQRSRGEGGEERVPSCICGDADCAVSELEHVRQDWGRGGEVGDGGERGDEERKSGYSIALLHQFISRPPRRPRPKPHIQYLLRYCT